MEHHFCFISKEITRLTKRLVASYNNGNAVKMLFIITKEDFLFDDVSFN